MRKGLSLRRHPVYRLFLWVALAASLALLWRMNALVLSNPKYIPVDDFSHYWAAGRLNTTGGNPYDPQQVQQLRNRIVREETSYATIPIMWSPPWSMPFVMPFGALDYPASRLLWLIAQVTIILACAKKTWEFLGGTGRTIAMAWGITFIFGPTISVLEKGQITPLVLAGITGFVYFAEYKKNDLAAGMFAVLIALKPQLYYLFWPIMLVWTLTFRRWRVLLGGLMMSVAAILIPLVFNPSLLDQYLYAVQHYPPTDWATPTLGGYLRLVFGIDNFWLQFVPALLGLAWTGYYWQKHRKDWRWLEATPILLLISILTAPYAWTYDQVILVPAILSAGVILSRHYLNRQTLILWGVYTAISLLDLFLHRFLDEYWFGWLAPAWLTWYIIVRYSVSRKRQETA